MPRPSVEEQALVQRAQSGEDEALGELYRRHSPAIYRYCFFRVHDRATAEDLTGEVFVKMVEALPRYVDRGLPFAAWLFRIAHDRVVDHHRRASHRLSEPLSDLLVDGQPGTESEALTGVTYRRLEVLIHQLTDEQQWVIQLRFFEGYNLDETAQLMQKSPGAIKALQHRALRQLERKLVSTG